MDTEQTDRQLLKWAAKASDMKVRHFNDLQNAYWIDESESWWNPLTDDGDALRLLVKLKIDLLHTNIQTSQIHALADLNVQKVENRSSDPNAATRRAIVRAAAEIGRNIRNG